MRTALVYLSIIWVVLIVILQASLMYPSVELVQKYLPGAASIYEFLHPLVYRDYIF